MYQLVLCWRYLRTRYLALVCIVSVMLGVTTLIVVNSVMAGFSTKLRERLHGLLSDVVLEASELDGFPDPAGKMEKIRRDPFLAERIEAMTATLEVPAMLRITVQGYPPFVRPVHLIGIDPAGRQQIGGFAESLCRQDNRLHPSFALPPDVQARLEQERRLATEAQMRAPPVRRIDTELSPEGVWVFNQEEIKCLARTVGAGPLGPLAMTAANPPVLNLLPVVDTRPAPAPVLPPAPAGVYLGYALAHYRDPETKEERTTVKLGDRIELLTVMGDPFGGASEIRPARSAFLVADYFRSEMSEYDSTYVFVDLRELQELRDLRNRATSIQIRLKDYREAKAVVKRLQELFPPKLYGLQANTWEDKQGPLLAAIDIEKGILNVLLFLIIGVAGFGILAIFSMIVVEKTRDIGILKALGASNAGILRIFLGYGLLLGVVGAILGTGLGLLIATYVNEIEKGLAVVTGRELFDRSVYYFDRIPTDTQPLMVLLVNVGAVAIAVVFSILPALRAAWLHPVRALRYE